MRIATILLCLSLPVLSLGQGKSDRVSVSEVRAAIGNLGYKLEMSPDGTGNTVLLKDGIRVDVYVDQALGVDDQYHASAVRLVRRYELTQPIDSVALNDRSSEAVESGIIFTHYLDRSLVARKTIVLTPGFDSERLRNELESYWAHIARMQTLLPKGWKVIHAWVTADTPPVDESRTIDHALGEDFSYLVRKWGWARPTSAGNSFTWWLDATIEGQWVQFRGVIENGIVDPYKLSIDVITQDPKFASATQQERLKRLDWTTPTFGDKGYANFRTIVDLRKGMTVGALKKLIVRYVEKAAALARQGS